MSEEQKPVRCAIDARGVAAVTLNRPAVGNAYDDTLIDGLIATCGRLARESGLRCVVLRGAGRHFQLGADLAFLRRLHAVPAADNLDFSRRTMAAIEGLQHFPRPTLAVIQGGCFGGGAGIAAACDIAIAAEDAVFAISEVRWGITAAPIVPLLTRRLGPRALGRWALTGERFSARRGAAHRAGPCGLSGGGIGERRRASRRRAADGGPGSGGDDQSARRRSGRGARHAGVSREARRRGRSSPPSGGGRRRSCELCRKASARMVSWRVSGVRPGWRRAFR
jgi:hypothetical protein